MDKKALVSRSKKIRHISFRYYFISDAIKSDEVEVQPCWEDKIVPEFFKKTLQGAVIRKFHDEILNV